MFNARQLMIFYFYGTCNQKAGLRCGSVETCRKPCCFDNREKAYAEAALSGSYCHGRSHFKEYQEDLSPSGA